MTIVVYCSSQAGLEEKYQRLAHDLGTWIGQNGHTLLYGGSNAGLMHVTAAAVHEAGGHVVGVIPNLFSDDIIYSQAVTELVRVRSMAERKERIMEACNAFVALPGGIGTLDEVLEVMVANQLKQIDKPMYLLNLDGFYNLFLEQLRQMHQMGFVRATGEASLHAVSDVNELFSMFNTNDNK